MDRTEFASHIDATIVRNTHTIEDVEFLIESAKKYQFACVFTLPCYMEYVAKQLVDSGVNTGGTMGFPSGGEYTETKLFETKRNVQLGAQEMDMVINIGWLKSGMYNEVRDEIRAIKDIAGDIPVKCILEMSLLTEEEARRACELVVEGGGDYVKTGTGWFGSATLENVALMKSVVGDKAFVKAAGGIRDKETALNFLAAGAYRLGIGLKNAVEILENW